MKRKNLFNLLMVLGFALILVGGVVIASRVQAQEAGPLAPQSAVDTAFTYQGRLIQSGGPVSDTCDFRFNLYDDAPSLVAGPVDKDSVTVSDGYFSTSIDFGADAFTGEGRQLGIAVRCPAGSGSYTDLSGLVMLHAAPYAHSLRPGATVSSTTSGRVLAVISSASSGYPAALYGEAHSPNGSGVSGSSSGYGVYGKSGTASGKVPIAAGVGVWGDSASSPGVYGTSNSAGGVGGWSTSGPGVTGISDSDNGVAGASSSGTGVYGAAPSTGTVGIATDSGGYGVYGYSASGHGVHGKANAPDGYGIYSEGNAYVEGELFWDAKTSYVSVSAAAFSPLDDNYMYTNSGNTLDPTDMSSQYYYAPVQLPHGATVTKIEFYWSDLSGDYNGHCYLYRNDMQAGGDTLGTVDTSGSSGVGSSETTTITNPTVDNSQYAYYLGWDLDGGGDVEGYGVVIEYTITEPY
jgi:hypothetical protein